MKNCPNCKKDIPKKAKQCPYCGGYLGYQKITPRTASRAPTKQRILFYMPLIIFFIFTFVNSYRFFSEEQSNELFYISQKKYEELNGQSNKFDEAEKIHKQLEEDLDQKVQMENLVGTNIDGKFMLDTTYTINHKDGDIVVNINEENITLKAVLNKQSEALMNLSNEHISKISKTLEVIHNTSIENEQLEKLALKVEKMVQEKDGKIGILGVSKETNTKNQTLKLKMQGPIDHYIPSIEISIKDNEA